MSDDNVKEKKRVKSIVDRLKFVIKDNKEKIDEQLKNHENKIYGSIILKFNYHILELESAIRFHLSQGELYSAKILLRSLIEHLATVQYVWCREDLLQDGSLTPELYFIGYRAAENIKRFGFDNKVKRILNENFEKDTVKAYYLENDLEPAVTHKILSVSAQFDLHNMVAFLVRSDVLNQTLDGFNYLFLETLNDYNFLSSYVHGGPSALFWDEENDIYNEEKINSDLDVFVGILMKILIRTYTLSSKDNSLDEQSRQVDEDE